MSSSLFTIPKFIEANSKKELVVKMRSLQFRLKYKLHFFDIQYAENKWIAWFEIDTKSELTKKVEE